MKRSAILVAVVAALVAGVWCGTQLWVPVRSSVASPAAESAAKPVSIVFLLRHAEKDGDDLSQEGRARAQRLAEVFKYAKVQHLIVSKLRRTRQTLEPLATLQKLDPKLIHEIGDLDESCARDIVKLVRSFKPGDITVIVHHSTTVQTIAEELGVPRAEARAIDTSMNDGLNVVLLPAEGAAQMVRLAYR